jgi:sulfate adenylyltransferase
VADPATAGQLSDEAKSLPQIRLSGREQCDLEMLAIGAFSPLRGFMGQSDFRRVCTEMRLASGEVFPIPITLCPSDDLTSGLRQGQRIALADDAGRALAVITVREKYPHDKDLEILNVYRTTDDAHPGVAAVRQQGNWCLAGEIEVISPNHQPEFAGRRLTPAQTRAEFAKRNWQAVVAFQTRNPIHRAHEYLTKCALEITDGLLVHPLVGETKSDDIPADVRMQCYEALIDRYYNPSRTLLAVMPLAMRYAGPREAILHAIIRKNYGCTHFIVGRDHAGVGTYYGTYDAQTIFDQFDVPRDIGIVPLKFEHSTWCRTCEGMVSAKTCPHGQETKVQLSGTKVRELLQSGQRPPAEFTRPEVADILIRWAQSSR